MGGDGTTHVGFWNSQFLDLGVVMQNLALELQMHTKLYTRFVKKQNIQNNTQKVI